jgi:hypothetical protein
MAMTGSCECGCTSTDEAQLERVRYFPRQLITPDDLTQEQEYFRAKMRRHERLMHGWGIVCGMEVVKNDKVPSEVVIKSGYVVGPYGDGIVNEGDLIVDMYKEGLDGSALLCGDLADPWCAEVRISRAAGQKFYLAIKYAECPTRPVRAYPSGCGCGCQEGDCQYSRTRDSFAVKLLTELPAAYVNAPTSPFPSLPSPCGQDGKGRPCPTCPTDPWVILADVTLDAAGAVDKIDLTANRRYVMSFADYFVHGGASAQGGSVLGTVEDWKPPTLQNGWALKALDTDYDYNPPGYFKDHSGVVHFRGTLGGGPIPVSTNHFQSVICQLPAGYRPPNRTVLYVLTSGNGIVRLDINEEGRLILRSAYTSWISLDGLTFRAG